MYNYTILPLLSLLLSLTHHCRHHRRGMNPTAALSTFRSDTAAGLLLGLYAYGPAVDGAARAPTTDEACQDPGGQGCTDDAPRDALAFDLLCEAGVEVDGEAEPDVLGVKVDWETCLPVW